MKKKNGFTLVELLAVIVVLAIIMVIAIPSILNVMNTARKNSFALYVDKVVTATQTQYISDSNSGSIPGAGVYAYNIETDLGLTSTGSYRGFVVVDARNVDEVHYFVFLRDNNYMLYNYDVTVQKMPTKDDPNIKALNNDTWNQFAGNAKKACTSSIGKDSTTPCQDSHGYVIVDGATGA